MKILKKMAVTAAAITFLLSLSLMTASAAAPEKGYDYKITLHAGNRGTIDGKAESITVNASYGADVTFDLSRVQVNDGKYYVKGVRLSGRDNKTSVAAPAFPVTGDADYVVAYGIKGDLVAYTVKYQDASGKQLAPDSTFYGNVGDKPIVAYKYIEKYVPKALALTKTLSKNEAENVFTFVYVSGEPGTITIQDGDSTRVVTVVVPVAVPANRETGTGTGTGAGASAGTAAGTDQDGNQAETPDENGGDAEVTTPDDLVDLDDTDTPAANLDVSGESASVFPVVAAIIIGVGALAALIALLIWLRKRTKNEEEQE